MPSSRSVYSSGQIDDLDRRASKLRWHLIKIDDGLGNCSELSDKQTKALKEQQSAITRAIQSYDHESHDLQARYSGSINGGESTTQGAEAT